MPEPETTTYCITFDDGTTQEFAVTLGVPALQLIPTDNGKLPEWTKLTFHQCPNCPLRSAEHPYCPIARNLIPLVDAFGHRVSHDRVRVVVQTSARTYLKACPLQQAVSSLMGLIMATSGCPHLDKLRPMVFTHLPFPTAEQTTYRAVGMYLLAQYFRQQHGLTPDWELAELSRAYEDIRVVNRAFTERLSSIQQEDANLNAIIKLDCQASLVSSSINEHWWEDVEQIFRPYFADDHGACGSRPSQPAYAQPPAPT